MRYDPKIDPKSALESRIAALTGKVGSFFEQKRRFFEHVLSDLDFNRYRAVQSSYVDRPKLGTYVKFLDLGYWLDAKFDMAWQFGLHERRPLSILDIGAGVGNFCYVCRFFGHDALAMDVGKVSIYDDLTDLFRVPRAIGRVDAHVPLQNFHRRFDLITAFMVVFDKKPDRSGNWHRPEWCFFLRDLARNHLAARGEILLKISLKNYDDDFRQFLAQSGGEIVEKGSFVHYKSTDYFRH